LGSVKASSRHEKHLQDLGRIPAAVGLKPFYGCVRSSDLRKLVKGTIAAISLNGYCVALAALLEAILDSDIPTRDRIEFLFEQKSGVEVEVSRAFYDMENSPRLLAHHGKSRIAKHSFIPKSLILEPSDYLAYACLQQLSDKDSAKAKLTSPILEAYPIVEGKELSLEGAQALMSAAFPKGVPLMDAAKKNYLKDRLKRDIEEKIGKKVVKS